MHTYKVSLTVKRGKINIIKLIRAITGWSLGDSKIWTEANFKFDDWMTDWATFDVVIGTNQMAAVAHYVATRNRSKYRDCEILDSEIVESSGHVLFDLTCL